MTPLSDEQVEGDALLIEMARALHPPSMPPEALPVARMDFSDAQWARLSAAAAVVRAPLLSELKALREENTAWSAEGATEAQRSAELVKRTCQTCRHFTPERDGYGSCARWLRGYGVSKEEVASDEVLVEDDEGWGMMVGPAFGCVLHEEADQQ